MLSNNLTISKVHFIQWVTCNGSRNASSSILLGMTSVHLILQETECNREMGSVFRVLLLVNSIVFYMCFAKCVHNCHKTSFLVLLCLHGLECSADN